RDSVEASAAAITAIILVLAIGVYWVVPIGSSLWLDETGTVWAIRGTLRETIVRAFHPGQPSVLFSVVTWLVVAGGGLRGVTLRLPSLVAAAIASLGVHGLVRRFGDASQSLLATALFATYGTVVFAAADARPYAPALMAVVWAMLLLVRWCETGRAVFGIAWAFAAALGGDLHHPAGTMVTVFVFCILGQDRVRRPGRAGLCGMSALVCVLLLPLLPHAAQLWSMRVEHSFSGMPELRDVIDALVYYRLAAGMFVGAVAARLLYPDFEVRRGGVVSRGAFFFFAGVLPSLPVFPFRFGF